MACMAGLSSFKAWRLLVVEWKSAERVVDAAHEVGSTAQVTYFLASNYIGVKRRRAFPKREFPRKDQRPPLYADSR